MRMVPVVFKWKEVQLADGELAFVMRPHPRYVKTAVRQFHPDEEYPLVVVEARSRASHNHYFAALNEGFKNLPENIQARWATSEHFRKWALVQTGWFIENEKDFGSSLYAKRAGLLLREFDEYVRMFQPNNGSKLIIRRAKSQSAAAMGKDAFEKSKRDVLDLLESMIKVERGTLMQQAGRAA